LLRLSALALVLMSPSFHSYVGLFSFYFYLSVDHRDLHSFPTRRSSDLRPRSSAALPRDRPRPAGGTRGSWSRPPPSRSGPADPRSEEHTSELQSRFDLVCRLLLEKKNKKRSKNHPSVYISTESTRTSDK